MTSVWTTLVFCARSWPLNVNGHGLKASHLPHGISTC